MIDVKCPQKDKYCIWPIERHNKNSLHSALFKSSNLDDTRALCHGLKILFYNFSDIKLSLIKIIWTQSAPA